MKANTSCAGCNSTITHLGRKLLIYLCKPLQKGKVACIQGHNFDRPCCIKLSVFWGLDITGGSLFTWNQSMLKKKCYDGVMSVLCKNINIKLTCTAMWLEGKDRWSKGQQPKFSNFYLFSPCISLFFLFTNVKNWWYYLSKIIVFTSKTKEYICDGTQFQYTFLKLPCFPYS